MKRLPRHTPFQPSSPSLRSYNIHKAKRRKAGRFGEIRRGEAGSNSNLLFGLGAPIAQLIGIG